MMPIKSIAILLLSVVSVTNAFGITKPPSVHQSPTFVSQKHDIRKSSPAIFNAPSFERSTPKANQLSVLQASMFFDDSRFNEDSKFSIEKDYRLAGMTLTLGLLMANVPFLAFTLAPLVSFLGVLFAYQTQKVDLVFGPDSFELEKTSELTGKNWVTNGPNKWRYDSVVNYEFFPKGWEDQPQGPILIYAKETQTPEDRWMVGPGRFGNSEKALAAGAKRGQVHWLPAMWNCQQIKAEWEKRGVKKL